MVLLTLTRVIILTAIGVKTVSGGLGHNQGDYIYEQPGRCCRTTARPELGRTGQCVDTSQLIDRCVNRDLEASVSVDCDHVDGNWCCYALSGSQPYQTDSPCELPSSQKQCGVTGSGSNLDFFAGSSANRSADRLTVKRARKKTRGTFASVRTRIPMGDSPDAPAVHVEPTIVGGFDAVPNQICWQANLVSVSWLGPESCGGVIIGPRTILTAAHCFTDPSTGERVPFYNVAVHVGALQRHGFHADKNESNGGCPEVYQLSRLTVHEDFDPESFNNDVTLLTLNRPIDFNNKPCACTACLEDLEPKPGDTCIVSGTGREFNGDNNTTVPLKWLPVEVLSQESDQCGQISNTTDLDLFVCAGPVFGENACQGDSGGPLVCLNPFNEFYLAATVSYGSNICAEDLGTEYTKTKAFLPWIRRNALPEDVL